MASSTAQKRKAKGLGALGEALGLRYLVQKGYRILETNYQNQSGYRLGEVDIIAELDGVIVFVEVKTRAVTARKQLFPEEAINRDKLHKLSRVAQIYLRDRKCQGEPYRFDALAVLIDREDRVAKIRHFEHIFL